MIMKNKLVYAILGFTLGSLVTSTFANDVKEFICQSVSYPIVVNGQVLQSDKPILNYSGSTYLPLKAIGDSFGTQVKWDDINKKVIIGDNVVSKSDDAKPMAGGDQTDPTSIEATPTPIDIYSPTYYRTQKQIRPNPNATTTIMPTNTPTPIVTPKPTGVVTDMKDTSYEHFKANFKIGELLKNTNGDLIAKVNYIGNLNQYDFNTWWHSLEREEFIKKIAFEIHTKSPDKELNVIFSSQAIRGSEHIATVTINDSDKINFRLYDKPKPNPNTDYKKIKDTITW